MVFEVFDESEHFYVKICSCEAIFNDLLDLKCHSSYLRLRNPFFAIITLTNVWLMKRLITTRWNKKILFVVCLFDSFSVEKHTKVSCFFPMCSVIAPNSLSKLVGFRTLTITVTLNLFECLGISFQFTFCMPIIHHSRFDWIIELNNRFQWKFSITQQSSNTKKRCEKKFVLCDTKQLPCVKSQT